MEKASVVGSSGRSQPWAGLAAWVVRGAVRAWWIGCGEATTWIRVEAARDLDGDLLRRFPAQVSSTCG